MRTKILKYGEVRERLKKGETISWQSDKDFHAYMTNNWNETVRYDTLYKLWKEGLITNYGFPNLHGTIKLKDGTK